MSSIGQTTTRSLRDEGKEWIINIPEALQIELGLSTGDELAWDGDDDKLELCRPENAGCYAPTRVVRSKSGELVINVPAEIVTDRGLEGELVWTEPKPDGTVSLLEAGA